MGKEIRINFKGGKVTIETNGYGGESCKTATEAFERKLGIVKHDELTNDYHHQEEANVQQRG